MKKKDESRNYITFNELNTFYQKSWIFGYKVLGMSLQNDKAELKKAGLEIPSIGQLTTWAKQFSNNIMFYLQNDLRESGINYNNDISYEQFRIWVYKNHHLQIHYAHRFITCATSLMFLDDVEYIDNLGDYSSKFSKKELSGGNFGNVGSGNVNSNQNNFNFNSNVSNNQNQGQKQNHGGLQYPTFD